MSSNLMRKIWLYSPVRNKWCKQMKNLEGLKLLSAPTERHRATLWNNGPCTEDV